jgi:hypothetical protein
MTVMLMYCGQCKSRRSLGRRMADGRLSGNVWRMIGKAYRKVACHRDTVNRVMEALDPSELHELIFAVFDQLRKSRALDRFRFDGLLSAAVDGTGVLSFSEPHCDQCTYQTHNGVKVYFHNVLAIKVVTPIGLVVPLAFEFIENPAGEYDKQDCELKAWRRLLERLFERFPRLKLNLLGDGLYAEETTFRLCDERGWNYVITLPEDKLPTVTGQLRERASEWTGGKKRIVSIDGKKRVRTVRWIAGLRYHGEVVHVIEMLETDEAGNRIYYNRWITNRRPDSENAHDLAQTGRLRWKIENEGTNTQKNGGYEMQHAFGLKKNAWKNYYLILQIAQLMNDLVRFTDCVQKSTGDPKASFAKVFETTSCFAERLIESLRNALPRLTKPARSFQLRFAT